MTSPAPTPPPTPSPAPSAPPAEPGPDGLPRCPWALAAPTYPDYRRYHDEEWGFPVVDDRRLFEKLCLEGFQSGLAWRTILAKREAFRAAFAGFDAETVAGFGEADVVRLLGDAGIVRHRGKIEAAIHNARRLLELWEETTLAAHVWSFEPDPADLPAPQTATTSPASVALARDLKRRGWRFVGPTTMHAFLQSMGLVDDHVEGCVTRDEVEAARAALVRPGRSSPTA